MITKNGYVENVLADFIISFVIVLHFFKQFWVLLMLMYAQLHMHTHAMTYTYASEKNVMTEQRMKWQLTRVSRYAKIFI